MRGGQLGSRRAHNAEVVGSIPTLATMIYVTCHWKQLPEDIGPLMTYLYDLIGGSYGAQWEFTWNKPQGRE